MDHTFQNGTAQNNRSITAVKHLQKGKEKEAKVLVVSQTLLITYNSLEMLQPTLAHPHTPRITAPSTLNNLLSRTVLCLFPLW